MKKADWVIAIVFILFGLSCFMMSVSYSMNIQSVHSWIMDATKYCLRIGLPMMILGFFYIWFTSRKR